MIEVKRLAKSLAPDFIRQNRVRAVYKVMQHILGDYGWLRSFREQTCVDSHGNAIPWFTYPAIDYLSQLDFRDRDVFEWGAGNSTIYWGKRARKVISVETNRVWIDKISGVVGDNVSVILSSTDLEIYCRQIERFDTFDVIVIDGIGQSRLPCSEIASSKLKPGGMIILDNSDLWPQCAEILRNSNLIQVDFTGLVPIEVHFQTTSVFLSRDFSFRPLEGLQPKKSVAQPATPWVVAVRKD